MVLAESKPVGSQTLPRNSEDFIKSHLEQHLPTFEDSHTPDTSDAPTSKEFEHTFDTSLWTAGVGSVKLNLTAEDAVGNGVQVEEEVKGAIDTMLDAMSQIWDAIAGVLADVAEAVADAVNVIVEFLRSLIREILMPLIQPILNMYEQWASNVRIALSKFAEALGIEETNNRDKVMSKILNENKEGEVKNMSLAILLTAIFTGGFTMAVIGLAFGMIAAEYAILTVISALGLGQASAVISNVLITSLFTVFETIFYTAGGVIFGEALYMFLYTILPEGHIFWGTTIGSMIGGSALIICEYIRTGTPLSTLFKPGSGDAKDLVGFTLAIFGGFLIMAAGASLLGSSISLIISVIGLVLALVPPESAIEKIHKGIGYLDELIDSILVGIAINSLVSELS